MITEAVGRDELGTLGRLDAWYYLAPGAAASRRLDKAKAAGLATRRLGGADGLAKVWMPNRLKQRPAMEGEPSRPYLKPHDLFRYLPRAAARLSIGRTPGIDAYETTRGLILQTRSGRNLGPSLIVDTDTAGFIVSDDLMRIQIDDERMRFYVVSYLQSRTGQSMLRRDKSGSVIDHLSVPQVEAQHIPLIDDQAIDLVSNIMRSAFLAIEDARKGLRAAMDAYQAQLPQPSRDTLPREGWGVTASEMTGRLDAASYDPLVDAVREQLAAAGGKPVRAVAKVLKPPGRYKTRYVAQPHGLPFMSGTQILQLEVINPRYMAERTFKDVNAYRLRPGWSVYQADGRAEEALGEPSLIPTDRDGWLASGHVGRLVPRDGTSPGWLWLAAHTWQAQVQIKALSSGSVVDSTFSWDMESVILPPVLDVDGAAVTAFWEKFAEARRLQRKATQLVDDTLAEISGVGNDELIAEETELAIEDAIDAVADADPDGVDSE